MFPLPVFNAWKLKFKCNVTISLSLQHAESSIVRSNLQSRHRRGMTLCLFRGDGHSLRNDYHLSSTYYVLRCIIRIEQSFEPGINNHNIVRRKPAPRVCAFQTMARSGLNYSYLNQVIPRILRLLTRDISLDQRLRIMSDPSRSWLVLCGLWPSLHLGQCR
jgi:hypothetical protein